MIIAVITVGVVSLVELLLWLPSFWKYRRSLALVVLAGLAISTIALLAVQLSVWTLLVAIFSLYRGINLGKLVRDRVHGDYLFHTTRRTAWWLISLQAAVLLLAALGNYLPLSLPVWWYSLAVFQIISALIIFSSTIRHVRTTRPPVLKQSFAEKELPTLTVAIPARNETADLEACLQSLVASTYPKLEILVLDDCSQAKRTPEIIREFAHAGVRFIAGQAPPDTWLAKNYAYQQLAETANGELLLFCGVDTRFEPHSLRRMVETLLHKQKTMLSLIPRNALPGRWCPRAFFLQPNRYAWELALPRRFLQRPPVLSTCWLITREALDAAGGFQAVTHKVTPESYFARSAARSQDGYSFLQGGSELGLSTRKTMAAQQATAIRTRYPQLHRRPELVAIVSLLQLSMLVWPLIVAIVASITGLWLLAILSAVACGLTMLAYSQIVNLTYRQFCLRGLWLLPFAALYDIGLLNYSMWLYEFREVIWKGRNVCLPVMHVVAKLPA